MLSAPAVVTFFHFSSVGRSEKLRASRVPQTYRTQVCSLQWEEGQGELIAKNERGNFEKRKFARGKHNYLMPVKRPKGGTGWMCGSHRYVS